MPRQFSKIVVRGARLAGRPRAGEVRGSERQTRLAHAERRRLEADGGNERLAKAVRDLQTILPAGLARDARVALDGLLRQPDLAGPSAEWTAPPRPDRAAFDPPPLGWLAALIPGARRGHAEALAAAEAGFQASMAEWERLKARRDAAIEALAAALAAGEPGAVKAYAGLVLTRSPYPETFHREVKVDFVPGTHEYVADFRVPTMEDIVPKVERFDYHKVTDRIVASATPENDRRNLYDGAIAQLTLRTFHEMFSTDADHHMETITVNVRVAATDPSTGKAIRPIILSARVSRPDFDDLELAAVEPLACLERLMTRSETNSAGNPRPS